MSEKIYKLSLARNYVAAWGIVEAVRELIQNALDSDSPFNYSTTQDHDGSWSLSLFSEGCVLQKSTLLLGSTSKAEAEDKIGAFGEGYKLALLVLTREDIQVTILNDRVIWTPKFVYDEDYEKEVLAIVEQPFGEPRGGVEFIISGLSASGIEKIRESCLQMQDDIGGITRTLRGDILHDRPGKLYVGGLFVCDTELRYGYNLKPNQITLERDRQTVGSFDLAWVTKALWLEGAPADQIAEMMAERVPDVSALEYGAPEIVREACYALFRRKYPGAVAAKSQDELERMVRQGMERVVVIQEPFYTSVVGSVSYREETKAIIEAVHERLARWLKETRREMRKPAIEKFKKLIEEAKGWKHK